MALLEVLGMNCRSCLGLLRNTEEAVRLEGRIDNVKKVSDYSRIMALNPEALPALAIDGKIVVAGRVATPAEIRQYVRSRTNDPLEST